MQLEYGGQRISVAAGEILIGSDPSAAVRLAGDGVDARHAVVRRIQSGNLVIEPGASGGKIRVNGASIGGDPTPLLHGDRIGIGSHEIVVVDPARIGATQVVARIDPAAPKLSSSDLGRRQTPGPMEPAGRLVCLNDGREYQIAVVPFVLGRDATAEVVIGSPDASRHHAEIVSRPDGDVVVDLSTNGTFVNGSRISGRHPLKALDVIRIGAEEFRYYPASPVPPPSPRAGFPPTPPAGAEFRLSDTLMGLPSTPPVSPHPSPPSPPSSPAAPAVVSAAMPPATRPLATMLVKSGTLKGQRLAVKSAVVNVGRAEYNEVRLPDPSISSSHVKLQLKEGVWTLTDLGSTNGTTVDGERVDDDVPLSPGAVLKLGEVSLSFEPLDERPAREDRTAVLSAMAAPVPASAPAVSAPVVVAARPAVLRPAPPPPFRGLEVSQPNRLLMAAAIVALIGLLAAVIFLI